MKKKFQTININKMGFLDWLYLGILLLRIANVIDWDWRIVLSPVIIIVALGFLYALWPYKKGGKR